MVCRDLSFKWLKSDKDNLKDHLVKTFQNTAESDKNDHSKLLQFSLYSPLDERLVSSYKLARD